MTNEGPALDSRALAQDLTKLDLEHFGSFKSCLRHSATKAADPAVTPASDKIEGFSGEVTHGDPGDQEPHPGKRGTQSYQHLHLATTSLQSGTQWTPYVDQSPTTDTHEDE
eukprot:Em0022g586a